jgi:hypothetical protein
MGMRIRTRLDHDRPTGWLAGWLAELTTTGNGDGDGQFRSGQVRSGQGTHACRVSDEAASEVCMVWTVLRGVHDVAEGASTTPLPFEGLSTVKYIGRPPKIDRQYLPGRGRLLRVMPLYTWHAVVRSQNQNQNQRIIKLVRTYHLSVTVALRCMNTHLYHTLLQPLLIIYHRFDRRCYRYSY